MMYLEGHDGDFENIQSQVLEVDALEAIFADDRTCNIEFHNYDILANSIEAPTLVDQQLPFLCATMTLSGFGDDSKTAQLSFRMPRTYPSKSSPEISFRCSGYEATRVEFITLSITSNAANMIGSEVCFESICLAQDLLLRESKSKEGVAAASTIADAAIAATTTTTSASTTTTATTTTAATSTEEGVSNIWNASTGEITFGRRAIYFHHIIAASKRQAVKENALELSLRCIMKFGWPGIVIIEGIEEDCVEYVKRLQRLTWKYMVVRCEEQESFPSTAIDALDSWRLLPIQFLETDNMSEVGEICKSCGLERLFLAALKIFKNDVDSHEESVCNDTSSSSTSHGQKSKKGKKNSKKR